MRKGLRKLETFVVPNHGEIPISFASASSMFSAELFGKTFSNQDINKLKTEILSEAQSRESTTWKPVILIKTGDLYGGYGDRRASGIEIEKRYLGTTIYPDSTQKQHLAHVSTEMHTDDLDVQNWNPCSPQEVWTGDTKETKLIDYTRERYETLRFLEVKMEEFKRRIKEVISSAKGAEFVDALIANKNIFLQDEFSKKMLSEPSGNPRTFGRSCQKFSSAMNIIDSLDKCQFLNQASGYCNLFNKSIFVLGGNYERCADCKETYP